MIFCVEKSVVKNHMNEIDYDMLMELKASLTLLENSQRTLFKIIKHGLLYAKKTDRIQELPVFPSADDYDIEEKPIQWLPENRQVGVVI